MSKRVKVLISVVAAVVLMAVAGAATVMAQEETPPADETESNPLLARVAGILGISEETLVNAIEQARQEVRDATCAGIMDRLLENEFISEEDAAAIEDWLAKKPDTADPEAIKEWLQMKPDISGPWFFGRIFRHWGSFGGHLQGSFGPCVQLRPILTRVAEILEIPEETLTAAFNQAQQEIRLQIRETALTRALERAVEQGRIDESEAGQITEWWNQRPDAVDRAFPGANILPPGGKQGGFGFHKGFCNPGFATKMYRWTD
jgi:hypothetical protein